MKKIFCLFLVLFLFGGCTAYKSVHYGQEYSPPTEADHIEILSFKPNTPYIKLGEVTLFGVTPTNKEHMLKRLKDMVAEMGGEAVIIEESKTPIYMPKPIQGLVIKWQGEEEVVDFKEIESDIVSCEEESATEVDYQYIK